MGNDTESASSPAASHPPLEGQALVQFQENLTYVECIAKTFLRKLDARHRLDDLVSAGREGLLDAVRRYDPGGGASFKGYAYLRIRGEIIEHLRRTQLSRRAYARRDLLLRRRSELVHSVSEAELEVAQGTPHVASSERAAEATLDEALSRYATAAALGTASTAATDLALAQEDAAPKTPEVEYQEQELVKLLKEEVGRLPEDEATVVSGLYFQQQSLSEVAAAMDCDKSWTCRLHRRAVERLAKRMRTSAQ